MAVTRRFKTVAWWVLLVWVAALSVWALRPLTDHVPTGVVDGEHTSVAVECARPIENHAGPDEAIPAVQPPRAYERDACTQQHRENRWMLLVNIVLIAGLAIGLITVARSETSELPAARAAGV
jgi:hypothetical protein